MRPFFLGFFLLTVVSARADDPPAPSSRDALRAFNDLVGTWRGTGTPAGSRQVQQSGFWQETITCGWKFQGADAAIVFDFANGKHYRRAELTAAPGKNRYRLRLETKGGAVLSLQGTLEGRNLVLESEPPGQRVVLTMLHDNRFLYREETLAAGKALYTKSFQVGATKEGVPFASGSGQPECIVTGGYAKTPVMYLGKTYYVCCSGCRDEFLANPEKYVREAASKKP